MRELKDIIENRIISNLVKTFSRSPLKLNNVHEADAEIMNLESSSYNLAITIDTISEEIKSGLYSDPYQIGWMSVMVNFSDIAAVGAVPIGIVISQIFPKDIPDDFIEQLQFGINDACKKYGTFVLGGDTNFGDELIITGCAIGTVEKNKFLKRTGFKKGDKIYLTGKAGVGNAYAVQKLLFQDSKLSFRTSPRERNLKTDRSERFLHSIGMTGRDDDALLEYFPSAKLEWRNTLLKYSSSCIDTSDGVFSSLDQLMRLNNIGFSIRDEWENILDETSKLLFRDFNIPLWFLLAGEHGEFELLFSIPPEKEKEFLSDAKQNNLVPIYVADVIENSEIRLNIYNKQQIVDTEKIRNLAFEEDFTPKKYFKKLMEIDFALKNV